MAEQSQKETIGKVIVLGARLSFASLFEMNRQTQDDGSVRETWKANLLLPKDKVADMVGIYKGQRMPILAALKKASAEAKGKKWGDETKWPKLKPEKLVLRDGDLEDWEGYPGNW